jgi:hypothetical protein
MTAFLEQQQPSPARQTRRRWRLALAGAGLAAVTAVVLSLAPLKSTPAYAITRNADGSVTFVINDVRDTEGASRALREAGVRAVVLPRQQAGACPAAERGTRHERGYGILRPVYDTYKHRNENPQAGTNSLVIRPETIPAGAVLVIGVSSRIPWPGELVTRVDLYQEPGPTCYE